MMKALNAATINLKYSVKTSITGDCNSNIRKTQYAKKSIGISNTGRKWLLNVAVLPSFNRQLNATSDFQISHVTLMSLLSLVALICSPVKMAPSLTPRKVVICLCSLCREYTFRENR
jgi:hypothetical protein